MPVHATSLASEFPEIAKEWDYERNEELRPESIKSGSNKKVWWKCSNDSRHSWEAMVANRTRHGRGCPFCSGRRVLPEDSLGALFPEISSEVDTSTENSIDPFEVTPYSSKKINWVCKLNSTHKWSAIVRSRTRLGAGCPICAGQRLPEAVGADKPLEGSFAAECPDLVAEWDLEKNRELSPFNTMAGSNKKIWWRCSRFPEHVWKTTPGHRRSGTGCPKCTRQTSLPELRIFTELKALYPDTSLRFKAQKTEIDIYIPQLQVGIEYDGSFYHANKIENDLAKNKMLDSMGIALIRLRERPLERLSPTDIEVDVQHELSKSQLNELVGTILSLSKVTTHKQLLDYLESPCFINDTEYKKYVEYLPDPFPEESLQILNPTAVKLWDYEKNAPLTPRNFKVSSGKRVWWKCKDGHSWEARIADFSAGRGCPFCSSNMLSEEKTFAYLHPELLAEWDYNKNKVDPTQIFARSGKKVWWKCQKYSDHLWEAPVRNRSIGKGCPFCGGRKVSRSLSLGTVAPNLAKEWDQAKNGALTPFDVLPGSGKKAWWTCSRGHSWEAVISSRKKNGCPVCWENLLKRASDEEI